MTASPWDALLRPAPIRLEPRAHPVGAAQVVTKTAAVLAELAARKSANTLSLAVACDLTPNQVWGLLKQPRALGQVAFEGGRWTINNEFPGAEVQRAVDLLRGKGWRVIPPSAARANTGV